MMGTRPAQFETKGLKDKRQESETPDKRVPTRFGALSSSFFAISFPLCLQINARREHFWFAFCYFLLLSGLSALLRAAVQLHL